MSQDPNSNVPIPFAAFDANVNLQSDVQVPLKVVTSKEAVEGEIDSNLFGHDGRGGIGDAVAAPPASGPSSKSHGKRNKKSKENNLMEGMHMDDHDEAYDIDEEDDANEAKSRVYCEGPCAGIIASILILVSIIEDKMSISGYENKEAGVDADLVCGFDAILKTDEEDINDLIWYSECPNNDKYCQILSVVGPLWFTFSILCLLTSLFSVVLFCGAMDCFKWNNKKSIMLVIFTTVLQIVIIVMCSSTECTLEQYEMYAEPIFPSLSMILIMVSFVFSCIQLFFMYKVMKQY